VMTEKLELDIPILLPGLYQSNWRGWPGAR
jgi:hypothetical protein